MKTYLGPTFAQRNLTSEIWCGTMSKDPDDTNIAKATAMDSAALQYVKGFGVQWNLQAAVATLAQKGPSTAAATTTSRARIGTRAGTAPACRRTIICMVRRAGS